LEGGLNLYAYVGGNPITAVDPLGLVLVVDSSLSGSYLQAGHYLWQDPTMKQILQKLIESPNIYHIKRDCDGHDRFDGKDTVYWDPTSALITTTSGGQTPALGLGHELAHAQGFDYSPDRYDTLVNITVPNYDTAEEQRVITGPETLAANFLGEGTRTDHSASSLPTVLTPITKP
jgi:hypothetical protein